MGEPALEEREDFSDDSICLCIPIPPEVEGVPDIPDNGEPHVTVLYIGPGSLDDAHRLCELIEHELENLRGEPMSLGELDHFDRGDFVVAHARVLISPAIAHARERLVQLVEAAGFEPKHHPGPWRPHATLEYLQPGQTYKGSVPSGSWSCPGVEVWRGNERFVNGAHGDKLARRGEKWLVLSSAGKELGEYDTEKEARERLRQIEAAKAAKAKDSSPDFESSELEKLIDQVGLARGDGLDEERVKRWLVEHISGARKMPRPRMAKLHEALDEFPYLKPPEATTVYRGLYNVPASAAGKLTGESDPVRDKSWTTSLEVAAKFASTEWCDEEPKEGHVGVVLIADADPSQLLLNHEALAELPGVADQWDERWGETLENAIRDEQEVLALGPLTVRTVKLVDMARMAEGGDGQARLVQDAAAKRYAPAVITEPKTKIEIVRVDSALLMQPEYHPDGWVEYTVFYSRAGNVQLYDGVREWRPREEVFSKASMESALGDPWELRHSKTLLNPRTVLGVARGCIRTFEPHPDGKHTWGRAKAWDQGLLDAIGTADDPGPAQEVSLAYRILADRRHGTSDDGDPFDQIATNIIINSLASEPKGRAGPSVRVHTDSVDRADVITRADAMLELARGVPSSTVYFDPANWVRYDSGGPSKEDDAHMNPMTMLITMLLESHGLTLGDVAESVGVSEQDLNTMLGDPTSMTDEVIGKLAGSFTPQQDMPGEGYPAADEVDAEKKKMLDEMVRLMGDGQMDRAERDAKAREIFDKMVGKPEEEPAASPTPPQPEREDGGTKVMVGSSEFMVPAEVAAELERLRKSESAAGDRADAAERKLADGDLIPRSDAAAMALAEGVVIGSEIALARASYGPEFEPEAGQLGEELEATRPSPRKDAAGEDVPVLMREDWQRAALTGALGDEDGAAEFARIMKASPAARSELMAMRLDDARKVIAARSHTGEEQLDAVARMRARRAEDKERERERSDSTADPLADAIDKTQNLAGQVRRAPAPTA